MRRTNAKGILGTCQKGGRREILRDPLCEAALVLCRPVGVGVDLGELLGPRTRQGLGAVQKHSYGDWGGRILKLFKWDT